MAYHRTCQSPRKHDDYLSSRKQPRDEHSRLLLVPLRIPRPTRSPAAPSSTIAGDRYDRRQATSYDRRQATSYDRRRRARPLHPPPRSQATSAAATGAQARRSQAMSAAATRFCTRCAAAPPTPSAALPPPATPPYPAAPRHSSLQCLEHPHPDLPTHRQCQ